MSTLLEVDDLDATINCCGLSVETLESEALCDSSELFNNDSAEPSPDSLSLFLDLNQNDDNRDEQVVLVGSSSDSSKADDSKTMYITGKMMVLEDGTSAFVQHSKNEDDEVYFPLYCGDVLYLLTDSILSNFVDKAEETSPKQLDKKRAYPCTYLDCTKSYTSLHHLKVHMRVHTGQKPFKCSDEKCNKAFSTAFGLKIHLRTHNGERPYVCRERECSKSFKTSGDLQKHIRTHTGERPFVCPIPECGRTFTTCNICKVHVRTHTGERPYKCTYPNCYKTFASVTNQRNHLRIHSGEKPFVCSVPDCGKRFTEYSSLYKHNQVHRNPLLSCSICGKACNSRSSLNLHITSEHVDGVDSDHMCEVLFVDDVKTDDLSLCCLTDNGEFSNIDALEEDFIV